LIAAKVTSLFAIAALIDHGVLRRRSSAVARHMLWTLAVVASLLVPVLGATLPGLDVPFIAVGRPESLLTASCC